MIDAWLGTIPQWVSAAAASAGVRIAYVASRSWQETLKQRRRDELLAATYDLAGALGAVCAALRRRTTEKVYGGLIDQLFVSLLSFEKYFVVAMKLRKIGLRNFLEAQSCIDDERNFIKSVLSKKKS